jgi:hypothetical protein
MVGVSKKRKLTPELVEEDDDVPSSHDGDESVFDSGDEDEGDEEEEEEEEDEEVDYVPPKTKVSKAKVKPTPTAVVAARPTAAARKKVMKKVPKKQEEEEEEEMEEEEAEGGKKPPAKKKTSAPLKKKPKAAAVEKPVLVKKGAANDFEIQPNKSGKVVDMSVVGPRYSTDQVRLDERHWMQIQTTFMRSKGVTFDQVYIGRNPREGEVSKDGTPPKPWTMNIPVRCLEPMLRGCLVLMGLTSYQL